MGICGNDIQTKRKVQNGTVGENEIDEENENRRPELYIGHKFLLI